MVEEYLPFDDTKARRATKEILVNSEGDKAVLPPYGQPSGSRSGGWSPFRRRSLRLNSEFSWKTRFVNLLGSSSTWMSSQSRSFSARSCGVIVPSFRGKRQTCTSLANQQAPKCASKITLVAGSSPAIGCVSEQGTAVRQSLSPYRVMEREIQIHYQVAISPCRKPVS